LQVAAIVAIALLDYADFVLILFLLLLNAVIGFVEEHSANNAVAALRAQLAPQVI
jgi:H+-transporting ATPase